MTGSGNGGRTRSFEALRASEELHRATLANISDAVFMTNDEGIFTYICPNVDVIFGYAPDEVQAMGRIERLLGPNLFDLDDLMAQGELRNVERQVVAKSGENRTILAHLKRVAIHGGTVLCTCRDVTELKRAEHELAAIRLDLAHAGRLALAGQLMASIVHELQQPFTSIVANASAGLMYTKNLDDESVVAELQEVLVDIKDQSLAASKMVERLRTLVRKRTLKRRPLNLNEVANSVLHLVQSDAARRGVAIRSVLAHSLPAVDADRVSMQQVILNLVMNAMDATEGNGEAEKIVHVRTGLDGDRINVMVSDTGHGLPENYQKKLFEAFYTTKAEGLGLGLAIARSIVEAHEGRIWAERNIEGGATFHMSLPARSGAGIMPP